MSRRLRGVGEAGLAVGSLPPHLYAAETAREFDREATAPTVGAGVWFDVISIDNRGVQGTTTYLKEWGWDPAGSAPPTRSQIDLRITWNGLPLGGYALIAGDALGTVLAMSTALAVAAENEILTVQARDNVGGINRSVRVRVYGWDAPLALTGG